MTTWHPATLAAVVRDTVPLLTRFLPGFGPGTQAAQPAGLPNHAVWTLGHCALTMHRLAERLDAGPLPQHDFITGGVPDPQRQAFALELIAYGSTPTADEDRYPDIHRARAIFEAAAERLACAVEASTPERLAEQSPWGNSLFPIGSLVARIVFHNGNHTGQLVDTRRALAMPKVVG